MKYHCTGCDYIYNEIVWDSDLWIPPHTFFESLSNEFFCPFCDTYKDDFVVFDEIINYPLHIDRLTQFEAEHYPEYEIVEDIFTYHIWQVEHSNDEKHFIYKVSLYDESWDKIDTHSFNFWQEPKWEFDIEYLDTFEVRVCCSQDGIFSTWMIERENIENK
jgi:rubredoxin/desulfoferrodoxin (superoxide reductase-like protein)